MDEAAARAPDARALSFHDGETLTFADVQRRVGEFRGHLTSAGHAAGERVAIMMQNSSHYPIAWLAIATSGGTTVPINKRAGTKDAGYILEHSRASRVICDTTTEAVAQQAARDRGLNVGFMNLDTTPPGRDAVPASNELHPGRIANIQYTSGTTGFPKGCLLTHRYWLRMGVGAAEALGLTGADRVVTAQPHSYIDPFWNVVACLLVGCELVILDGFHPSRFMRDVYERKITTFYCLGVMPTLLLKQPAAEWDRRHRLRAVYCSAIPTDKHADIEERFGVPWFEAFGMTETGLNTIVTREEHDELVGTGCIGRPVSYCEASILAPDGTELPPGRSGEFVLRGAGFMNGYLDDAGATASFFAGGWAHTGDLAEMDEVGRIYYKGRLKEMIRRGGENVAPGEIEEAIASHPAVLECAVTSVPDPDLEEEIKAYVVLVKQTKLDARGLASFLQGRLATFKIPRYVEFRAALPHTPSERVAKHLLERDLDSWRENTVDLRPAGGHNHVSAGKDRNA